MNSEAIRLIDTGLKEAIRWIRECDSGEKHALFGPELDLHELQALSESLRDPRKLDLERWAYALAIFHSYNKKRTQSGDVDIVEVLLILDDLKKSVCCLEDSMMPELERKSNV